MNMFTISKVEVMDELQRQTINNLQFNVAEWSMYDAVTFKKIAALIERELKEGECKT